MKFKLALYSTFSMILVFLATSCQAPKELVYRDFKNLSIEKIGFGGSSLKVDLIYYNPNNFGLQLKYTDLDIYVDNNYLGHSAQDYQITIPRLAEFTLPLQIELDMQSILKNALPTLMGKEVLLKISGKVKLGKGNVFKTFPVAYETRQRFTLY